MSPKCRNAKDIASWLHLKRSMVAPKIIPILAEAVA